MTSDADTYMHNLQRHELCEIKCSKDCPALTVEQNRLYQARDIASEAIYQATNIDNNHMILTFETPMWEVVNQ